MHETQQNRLNCVNINTICFPYRHSIIIQQYTISLEVHTSVLVFAPPSI